MTEQEKYIPTLKKLTKKILSCNSLTNDEKATLSAIILNQIHIQKGSAEIVTYDDVDIYEFVLS